MFARKVAYNIIIVMSFHFVFDEGTILITDQYKKLKIRYREREWMMEIVPYCVYQISNLKS